MAKIDANSERLFGIYFFSDVVDWIRENLEPSDVFDIETLKESVQGVRAIKPEDIFDPADLEAWALSNGFVEDKD